MSSFDKRVQASLDRARRLTKGQEELEALARRRQELLKKSERKKCQWKWFKRSILVTSLLLVSFLVVSIGVVLEPKYFGNVDNVLFKAAGVSLIFNALFWCIYADVQF
mgnify:CR=1 FL=1